MQVQSHSRCAGSFRRHVDGTRTNLDFTKRLAAARRSGGFTLIELMVVVAIIAILASIAIPSYQDYLLRSKLTEAFNALSAYRVSMEQYYQDNRTYLIGSNCAITPPTNLQYFTMTCTPAAGNAVGYVADATGKTSLSQFTYQIDQSNNHTTPSAPANYGTSSSTCWIARKGGGC